MIKIAVQISCSSVCCIRHTDFFQKVFYTDFTLISLLDSIYMTQSIPGSAGR